MVIPDEGKQYWLDVALGIATAEDFNVQLYTNNYTPVDGTTATDFTAATFTGSGAFVVAPGYFSASVIVANVAESDAVPFPTWTNSGATTETCYGWYAVSDISGVVVAAQRFDNARVMSPGATEDLDPFRIKLKTFA